MQNTHRRSAKVYLAEMKIILGSHFKVVFIVACVCMCAWLVEVIKFLDSKMHHDADLDDSALMQRQNIIDLCFPLRSLF